MTKQDQNIMRFKMIVVDLLILQCCISYFRRKSVAFRRFNSMPIPRLALSPEETNVHTGNQSTPQSVHIESAALNMSIDDSDNSSNAGVGSTSASSSQGSEVDSDLHHTSAGSTSSGSSSGGRDGKVAQFYMGEESCSQDSGLEADRTDSRDSTKDSVSGSRHSHSLTICALNTTL